MAKLYYRHGTMRSGKSIDVIRTYDSYEKSGRFALVLKPAIDTRNIDVVATRKGYEISAITLKGTPFEIVRIVEEQHKNVKVHALIIDEAQFLGLHQVEQLTYLVDELDIPVLCYGLKTDFKGRLFEGSKLLLEQADNIEEIKTVCQYCDKKAIMNLRTIKVKNNILVDISGKTISIGDDEYIQTCRKCYKTLVKKGRID